MAILIDDAVIAISAASGFFKSLGINIAGKTQHFPFADVSKRAEAFQNQVYPAFIAAYGSAGVNKIIPYVCNNGQSATQTAWTEQSLTLTVAKDFADTRARFIAGGSVNSSELSHLLGLYFVWVMGCVDVDRPETFEPFLRQYFDAIFLNAVKSAGLEPQKIAQAAANPFSTESKVGVTTAPQQASILSGTNTGTALVALMAIGVAAAIFFKK